MDDLFRVTSVMEANAGVLRPRDHPRSRTTVDALVRSGAIVRVFKGTYVDARLLHDRRTRCAAALATYPGSVLWGAQALAATTHNLGDTAFGPAERISLAHAAAHRPQPAVQWVRRSVPAQHRVRVHGLRCPSAAYLAVEAAVRDDGELIERFLREGRLTPADLDAVLPAFAGGTGVEIRRRVVRSSLDNPWSGGERKLQELLRTNRIGGWVANAELDVEGRRAFPDLYFSDARLVVEFDGFAVHTRPDVFELDRDRQNALVLAGYTVLRYTWKQLTTMPDGIVRQLSQALARGSARDSGSGDAR